jgi:APA family basic amino acid/polyamine antiporter
MATAAPKRSFLGRIGLRKSVAQIQEETRTSELKRSLGPWNLGFLGIGPTPPMPD